MEFLHRNINSNGTKTLVPTHISVQVKHCLVSSGTYILHTMYSMLNSRLAISQCSISTSLVPCHHDEEWNKGTNMADTICVKYTEIYKHTFTNMPVRTHTHQTQIWQQKGMRLLGELRILDRYAGIMCPCSCQQEQAYFCTDSGSVIYSWIYESHIPDSRHFEVKCKV